MNRASNGQFLPVGALITWLATIWAYGQLVGALQLAIGAGAMLAGVGVVCLALRFYFRKTPQSLGIFFPVGGPYRGAPQSIRLTAMLLIAYNIGVLWIVAHASFSLPMIQAMLAAGTISAMNLADECWIARRRRLARS